MMPDGKLPVACEENFGYFWNKLINVVSAYFLKFKHLIKTFISMNKN